MAEIQNDVEKITDVAMLFLDNPNFDREQVKYTIKESLQSKQKLRDLLFDGEYMIKIPIEESQELKENILFREVENFCFNQLEKYKELEKTKENVLMIKFYNFFINYGSIEFYSYIFSNKGMDFKDLKLNDMMILGRILLEAFATIAARQSSYPEVSATKFSKQIKQFLELHKCDPKGIELFLIILSQIQSFNSKKMTGEFLTLSTHPLDFLTMSSNDYNWTSCVRKDGDHFSSSLSLMQDHHTIVAYVASEKSDFIIDKKENVYWNNKKMRTLVHFSKNFNFVAINRHYPVYCGTVSEAIKTYFIKKLNLKNETHYIVNEQNRENFESIFETNNHVYFDLLYDRSATIFGNFSEDEDIERKFEAVEEFFVGESVICLSCGCVIEYDEDCPRQMGSALCDFCSGEDEEDYYHYDPDYDPDYDDY